MDDGGGIRRNRKRANYRRWICHLKSKRTKSFENLYLNLPKEIQKKAKKAYILWSSDPSHPSLHFKKIGEFYSVRIADKWRVLGIVKENTIYWIWIGSHESYNQIIKK